MTTKLATEYIHYRDGDVNLTGMFALPEAQSARSAGVMVVHGGAGLDEHARSQALRLAQWGYVVFACDLYGDGVAGDRERVIARIMELRQDTRKLCQRASAGLAVLRSHPQVDGRLAAVGYCFGGMTVLELARSGVETMGVVSVHGTLATSNPAETVETKILVCHGALDPHVPMEQVNAFVAEMNHARADWQLNIYGGARHGFTHKQAPHPPGVEYHAEADARSAHSIRTFLAELFGRS
ncbi:MAG TPA: dienelactone hydrolase family protein [Acidisarcina sp.]